MCSLNNNNKPIWIRKAQLTCASEAKSVFLSTHTRVCFISRGLDTHTHTLSVLHLKDFQQHKFLFRVCLRAFRRSSASQNEFHHENSMSQRWDSLSTATLIISRFIFSVQISYSGLAFRCGMYTARANSHQINKQAI